MNPTFVSGLQPQPALPFVTCARQLGSDFLGAISRKHINNPIPRSKNDSMLPTFATQTTHKASSNSFFKMRKFQIPKATWVTCIEHTSGQPCMQYTSSPSFTWPVSSEIIAHSRFILVSSDSVIAITFGILSTIISLLGVIIAYLALQLRAMSICIEPLSFDGQVESS
jgi:hypothetical protein